MRFTVRLKYDIGDVVSIENRGIPSNENVFIVDGYSISFKPEIKPRVLYLFHCYGNDYVNYHEYIEENDLTSLKDNHSHEAVVDVRDVFGSGINFGEQVYYGLYRNKSEACNTLSFISGGRVEEITYYRNDYIYNTGAYVTFHRNILHTKPNGDEWEDSRKFGHKSKEPVSMICKSVPDTFYKDIADSASGVKQYLYDEYVSHTFKCLMDIFGQYGQAKEYIERLLEENRQKRLQSGKPEKIKDRLAGILQSINDLTDEDRVELIEMLKVTENG